MPVVHNCAGMMHIPLLVCFVIFSAYFLKRVGELQRLIDRLASVATCRFYRRASSTKPSQVRNEGMQQTVHGS